MSGAWTKADVVVTQSFWRRPLSTVMEASPTTGFWLSGLSKLSPRRKQSIGFPTT